MAKVPIGSPATAKKKETAASSVPRGRNLVVLCDGTGNELGGDLADVESDIRSEEHTSELQSLMRISYAVFCLKKKESLNQKTHTSTMYKLTTLLYTFIVTPDTNT